MIAAMHMDGLADSWYLDYVEGRENMGWEKFSNLVLQRFSVPGGDNLVGQFNKLRQEGTVIAYVNKFEELKAFMLNMNRSLSEEYFIKSFISGLKEEISQMVEMLNPTTLSHANHLALKQEAILNSLKTQDKCHTPSSIGHTHQSWKGGSTDTNNLKKPTPPNNPKYPPIKRLNKEEMEAKGRQGL
ncbi:hypothetical protein Salat_2710400 [Sesamum alatum]|uniref:Ty3 transposon capsid-like protein domain-containing protein n=1 Tax=Sesamum alatum TaxID=300844 RepID=A0AAE2CBM3_9LAMI|nr:hypothetical protein Salat_2710400 [Sesamum alatum]